MIAALVFGLLFAELVNHRYPGRGIVRTMFITPFLVMPVVGALTWKNMMLNPVFGVVDYVMQLFGLPAVDWLAPSYGPAPPATAVVRNTPRPAAPTRSDVPPGGQGPVGRGTQ